jgi:hypothetical protein
LAIVLTFLVVIPEGDLRLPLRLILPLLLPLPVSRRHPERSEGSLYLVFAVAVAVAFAFAHPVFHKKIQNSRKKFNPPKSDI